MIGFKIGDEFLDIPPDTSIPIEWESGLFEYTIGGIGVLPFSFSFTDKNKRQLQYFNLVSTNIKSLVLDCDLYLLNNFFAKGKLTVAIKGERFDCDWSEVRAFTDIQDVQLSEIINDNFELIAPFVRRWRVNYSFNTPAELGLNIYINGLQYNFEVPYVGQSMEIAINELHDLVVADSLINSLFNVNVIYNPVLINAGALIFESKNAVIIEEAESFAFIIYGAITTAEAIANLNTQTAEVKNAIDGLVNTTKSNTNYCFPMILNTDFYESANSQNVKDNFSKYLNYYFNGYVRNQFLPSSINTNLYKYAISPQLFLFYVIEKLLSHLSLTLSGNFKDIEQIRERCFIYNNFALDAVGSEQTTALEQRIYNFWQGIIKAQNHIPEVTVGDFLKAIKEVFCISYWPESTKGVFRIDTNKSLLENANEIDWTGKNFKIYDQLTGNFEDGFKLLYSYDNGDKALSDKVKSVEYLRKDNVNTFNDLPNYGVRNGEIRLVEDESTFYVASQPEVTPGFYPVFEWKFYSLNLHSYKYQNSKKELQTKHCPTVMLKHNDVSNNGRLVLTPEITQGGSSIEYNLRLNRVPFRLLFYWGLKEAISYPVPPGEEGSWSAITDPLRLTYPFASFDNYDINENQLGEYALRWEGPHGLYEKLHKDWLEFLNTTKKLKIQIKLSFADLIGLDLSTKIRIGESLFFIERVKFNVSNISNSEVIATVDLSLI